MQWSVTIGNIAGTAIRMHITFVLFLIWIAISDYNVGGFEVARSSVVFIVLVFACVVAHEFGHILVARAFGVKTPEVTLLPIGGVANMERMPEKPKEELMIAIAGPLVNVVIAALLFLLGGLVIEDMYASNIGQASTMQRLAFTNVALVVFNMVPAFPMDGGRVLRALLAMRMGPQRAIAIAAKLGQAFAFLFVAAGILYNPILILVGLFVYIAAESELQASMLHWFIHDLKVSEGMERSIRSLREDTLISEAVDAFLASPQHAFPIVDEFNMPVGILDRDDLLAGLRRRESDAAVSIIMRDPAAITAAATLEDAIAEMARRGLKSRVVVDGRGRLAGMLTLENIAEMMMIHKIRPNWKFSRSSK
jgi:Zn-dependent protease